MLAVAVLAVGYSLPAAAYSLPAASIHSLPLPAARRVVTATMTVEAPTATSTIRPDLAAELGNEPAAGMADEAALLAASTFPIPPDELVALAKAFTAAQLAPSFAAFKASAAFSSFDASGRAADATDALYA